MNLIRKAEPRDFNMVILDMNMLDVSGGQGPKQKDVEMKDVSEEVFIPNGLDPMPSSLSPKQPLINELEIFSVDPQDPTRLLQVRKGLLLEIKEKIKDFLCKNFSLLCMEI